MLKDQYGLTNIEMMLMKFFWAKHDPVEFSEVVHYCNEIKGHSWAQTTIHTYLTRLLNKGVLDYQCPSKKNRKEYFAKMTYEEVKQRYAEDILADAFEGSLSNFVLSFTWQKKLTPSDVDYLKKILDDSLNS